MSFFIFSDILSNRMIELNTFKQILQKHGTAELSEEEILKLRDEQDQMADIFFDMWLKKVKNQNEV